MASLDDTSDTSGNLIGASQVQGTAVYSLDGELSAELRGGFTPLSMEKLTTDLGLLPMGGTISASIPKMTYAGSRLTMGGALTFKIFDGDASLPSHYLAVLPASVRGQVLDFIHAIPSMPKRSPDMTSTQRIGELAISMGELMRGADTQQRAAAARQMREQLALFEQDLSKAT